MIHSILKRMQLMSKMTMAMLLLVFTHRIQAQNADFKGEPTSGFATLQVVFTDLSTGYGPNSTSEWEFPGGDPSTGTGSSVTVDYHAAGSYDVILKIMIGGQEAGRETKIGYITVFEPWDYGDAPDPSYPTKQQSNGARHLIDPKVYLGQGVDPEPDGQAQEEAAGDDQDGNDDEDGVNFQTQLVQGDTATVEVSASVSGMLKAWVDFNQDGDWGDAGEMVCDTQVIPGSNILQIIVPMEAKIGDTFARFRFSKDEIPSFDGPSNNGEVEDYMIVVFERIAFPYEYGDAPEGALAYLAQWIEFSSDDVIGNFTTCLPYGRVRHGNLGQRYFGPSVDYETDGNAGNCASGLFNMDETARGDGDAGMGKAWAFQMKTRDMGSGYPDYHYVDFVRFRSPLFVPPCSHPLFTCEVGVWGNHLDMDYHVDAAEGAYVNVLADWNLNGRWCEGGMIFHCSDAGAPHLHEHILRDFYVPPGEGWLSALDPPDFRIGATPGYVWIRFTISDVPVDMDDWTGHANFADGESEDYLIWVADPASYENHRDWGDAPDGNLAYPSLGVDGRFPTCGPLHAGTVNHGNETGFFNVYLGSLLGQPSVEPNGNRGYCGSLWNLDDDFALKILTPYTIEGAPGSETVVAEWFSSTHTETSLGYTCQTARWGRNLDLECVNRLALTQDAYLNVLIDWNQDGQWGGVVSCDDAFGDANEHVLQNFRLEGDFLSAYSLTDWGDPPDFRIGPNAGYVWARFTITPVAVELPWDGSGSFHDGETEDYLLKVEESSHYDYGDIMWPGFKTLTVDDGAIHLIQSGFFMGDTVDADPDGLPDPDAQGDDKHGVDDEDGVTFPQALIPGSQATLEVVVSAAGILNAWIDFDADTSWDDAGEHILNDRQMTPGKNTLSISIPADAVPGMSFARFRFSDVGGLPSYGPSQYAGQGGITETPPIGEVEDYEVIIGGFEYEYGDAPEGVLAYPHLGTMGQFPTCKDVGPAGYVRHGNRGGMYLGFEIDYELDGNAGLCPVFGSEYDADEKHNDIRADVTIYRDIGLIEPFAYTITERSGMLVYWPYSVYGLSRGALGEAGETAEWGNHIDIQYHVSAAEGGYLNMLIDWNQDGNWGDPDEHVLQNFPIPAGIGKLSDLDPPAFTIGPTPGHAWVRVTISETTVDPGWDGCGQFADGETEDYLICVTYDGLYDYGDAPEGTLAYPSTGVLGNFPTCLGSGEAGYIRHQHGGLRYFVHVDYEYEGNAGICPPIPLMYDADESFYDTRVIYETCDAGLRFPFPHQILGMAGSEFVAPYDDGTGLAQSLGSAGQMAEWGTNLDLSYFINGRVTGAYVNVLIDWNQDGDWLDIVDYPSMRTTVPERVLRNFHITGHGSDMLSSQGPPSFRIGPNPGYVWMRCTITSSMVEHWGWDGSGEYVDGETEDYLIKIDDFRYMFDFGDAFIAQYGVFHANNAAIHTVQAGFCLGDIVDADPDGQPGPGGSGDDNDGSDDDDGVVFLTPLIPGETAQMRVRASASGILSAWIDFDADTSWDDAGEQILTDVQIAPGNQGITSDVSNDVSEPITTGAQAAPSYQVLTFDVPDDAVLGVTYSRFRFSNVGGLSYNGPPHFSDFPDQSNMPPVGEVEDHTVLISAPGTEFDYGDAPDPSYPTLIASVGAWHAIDPDVYMGNRVDGEGDGQPDALGEGDDLDGTDDEDGVAFLNTLTPGNILSTSVTLSTTGFVNIWIDLNGDGNWSDFEEHILADSLLGDGTHTLDLPIPDVSVTDSLIFARVRFSTVSGLSYFGPAPDGEVEDYRIQSKPTRVSRETGHETIPSEFMLLDNYPNPFNPETKIQYRLPAAAHVRLKIFNLAGQQLRVLVDEQKPAGMHSIRWDARDDQGRSVEAGVYLYRIEAGRFSDTKKLLLVK